MVIELREAMAGGSPGMPRGGRSGGGTGSARVRTAIGLCLLAGGIAGGMAAPAPAGEPFVLSDVELDRITAGGLSVVADAGASAFATGSDTLTDTVTDAQANPGGGTAYSEALGTGVDGAGADGFASVSGTDDQSAQGADAGGQATSPDATPAIVASGASLAADGSGVTVSAAAVGDAPESLATASAGIRTSDGESGSVAVAASDALSLDGAPTAATASVGAGTGQPGSDLAVAATSEGDAYAASTTATESAVATPTGTVQTGSLGDAVGIGEDSRARVRTRQRVGTNGRATIGVLRTSAFSTGEEVLDPIAVTAVDPGEVPEGAVVRTVTRDVSRVVGRPGTRSIAVAHSVTVFMIREPRPGAARPLQSAAQSGAAQMRIRPGP